jgi:hypothetical protein
MPVPESPPCGLVDCDPWWYVILEMLEGPRPEGVWELPRSYRPCLVGAGWVSLDDEPPTLALLQFGHSYAK